MRIETVARGILMAAQKKVVKSELARSKRLRMMHRPGAALLEVKRGTRGKVPTLASTGAGET